MMKAQKSILEFLDYRITKFEYINASFKEIKNINYEVLINTKIGKPVLEDKSNKYLSRLDLDIQIKGKSGRTVPVKVKCSISGLFSASTEINEEEFLKLCSTSGFANLIMISRSVIISFTSQTGNKPIVLPLINLLKTYEKRFKEGNIKKGD
ncbi:protein-export chaperone SecB [Thermosipho ferrireducens]|uniref:Protein-export chaperone SecB n=1 Tax=Thermosipho ferrireducens TaxID=2571116 RepID=A0ABX7S9W7_9BACT|nr:protein-export chaperone SecB [Thermosipho ferrireducens]QTA38522.1 protein-export chaperone SecB [Thermosipho ferrireducens]